MAEKLSKKTMIQKLIDMTGPWPENFTVPPGDDAAALTPREGTLTLLSTDLLLEGIHFDLTYFPLKHLGYKAVVRGIEDICAMNGKPVSVMLSLGVSSKLGAEHLQEIYAGVNAACQAYGVSVAGGDLSASMTGLTIAVTASGEVEPAKLVRRGGANPGDLVCITGECGSAYLGLHLLEREKRAFEGHPSPQPKFEGYEYLLGRQLKPEARVDIIEALDAEQIVPTSMIDLTNGIANDLGAICSASGCGARIYLDRLPIAAEASALADELNIDPVVAALQGGDDHELLFTVPVTMGKEIRRLGGIEIIGHTTAPGSGLGLVTPDGNTIDIGMVQ